jgi:ATP-dependent helicase/DNAse subunit B
MKYRSTFLLAVVLDFLGGAVIGAWYGFDVLASGHWRPMVWNFEQLAVSESGWEAYKVLTALDAGNEAFIREMLESDVDESLRALERLKAEGKFENLIAREYENLKRYRSEHPRGPGTAGKVRMSGPTTE